MAFCTNCGQNVAEGANVCPNCGTPVGVAAPTFSNAPEVLDYIPSENSAKMPMFAYIGMAGAAISFILCFINMFSSFKLYYALSLISAAATGIAMYYVYDSLKKGLRTHKAPMTSLLSTTSFLAIGYYGLTILTAVLLIGMGMDGLRITASIGILTVIVAIVYFILSIIVGAKLIGNYTGNVKTIGLIMILIPIVAVLMLCVGVATASSNNIGVMAIVFGLISCVMSIALYLTVNKAVAGK